jgi:low temperature requirement protein LtrA
MSEAAVEREQRVTPLELFFDLVFAFGFTQVTTQLAAHTTWGALARALLVLGALWWTWAGYAWLTNTVDADEGTIRGALLVATGAMFVAALAVPGAFDRHRFVFAAAFLVVTAMHVALFALVGRGDPGLLTGVLRMARTSLTGAGLVLVAAFVSSAVRPWLWAAALLVGYVGPLFLDVTAWRVQPAHFVERHGLILTIAVGESLVAIGLGTRGTALGGEEILAAALGFACATSLWFAYFDFFAIRARVLLDERSGRERSALARDLYTYLHFPMVAGIVLFALAMKKTLAHVGHDLDTIAAVGLCGGCALYLLAFVALRFRVSRTIGGGRLTAAALFACVLPVAIFTPALAALAIVTGIWAGLHAYEIIWWRQARAEARALRAASGSG